MFSKNPIFKVFAALMLVAMCAALAPMGQAQASDSVYFDATGHTVRGAFLNFFYKYGGLEIIGYPLTDEVSEGGYTVQYFERERFEYHPENAGTNYEVLLSRLGYELSKPYQPFAPGHQPTSGTYFAETNHSLSGAFRDFWQQKGGLSIFGFPISEQFTQNGLTVQYFERARFEYHPEHAAQGFPVELGLLGSIYLKQHSAAPAPVQNKLNPLEQQLIDKINATRQANGVGPVSLDDRLIALARSRSNDMVQRNYFSHTTPDGITFLNMLQQQGITYGKAGEIINRNTFPSDQAAQTALDGFLNSPSHKTIMLDGQYTSVGIGETEGLNGWHYYTVIFLVN